MSYFGKSSMNHLALCMHHDNQPESDNAIAVMYTKAIYYHNYEGLL